MILKLFELGYIVILHLRTMTTKIKDSVPCQEIHYISEIAMKYKYICMLLIHRFIIQTSLSKVNRDTLQNTEY